MSAKDSLIYTYFEDRGHLSVVSRGYVMPVEQQYHSQRGYRLAGIYMKV